ncbi:MAG TPA: HEAT repeat domain-containing protein [Pirellulales bacterium]|nr:HEAT repeat domain-containing protein [Pirellulales bacterium]
MRDESALPRFALLLLALLAPCGCSEFRLRKLVPQDERRSPVDSHEDRSESNGKKKRQPRAAKPRRSLNLEGTNKAAEESRNDGWNAAAPEPSVNPSEGYRWRHFDLEALVALPPDERPDLIAALEDLDAVVATNSAICLARLGDSRGRDQLIEAVRDSEFRLPMRCAAAEALAGLPEPATVGALRQLADRYGDFTSRAYPPELHAELLYGLAANVDAGTDERFVAAVKSQAAVVRLAAIRAWVRPGKAPLAEEAADLRTDQDHRVRAAAIAAMAQRQHPLALDAARSSLTDDRLEVRLAAIAALGQIGGPAAQQALEKLDGEKEIVQAAVIAAFAKLGDRDHVWAGAESSSWYVRRAVAAALSQWPDAGGVSLARRLLVDPSIEVQKQVLVTLAAWPLDASGNVLLEAMGGAGYLARKLAAAHLAKLWPPAREFTPDAPAERRAEVLARLRTQWAEDHAGAAPLVGSAEVTASVAPPEGAERVQRVARIVSRLQSAPAAGDEATAALRELTQFGPDLPAVLDRLVDERNMVLPDAVYRQVLPKWGGAFDALDRLQSSDVHERRRATNSLAALAAREPLSGLALARLSELGASERDTLVLAGLFQAVASDGREPAVRLAYAGLGHRSAEVRRLAADYLAAYPAPEHVRVLLPALEDKNHAVVLATIKALGHPGVLADTDTDTEPLERLLTSHDREIRLAVTESLVILGAESGPRSLELLAHDNDIDTRREAAQMMGRHADRRYAETLIGLLDDTLGVRTAALASLPLVAGRDVADRPDAPPTSTLERVERWKKWWQSEGARIP